MSSRETAMIDDGVRSADGLAETRVECFSLSRAAFEELGNSHPALKTGLLRNALRVVSGIAGRLTGEVLAVESRFSSGTIVERVSLATRHDRRVASVRSRVGKPGA